MASSIHLIPSLVTILLSPHIIYAINVPSIPYSENRPPDENRPLLKFNFLPSEYNQSPGQALDEQISSCKPVYKSPADTPEGTFYCRPSKTSKKELELFAGKPLDREAVARYEINFKGFNGIGSVVAESKNSLIVTILDENDNSPIFRENTLDGFINDGATIGSYIVTVKATDKDDPREECFSDRENDPSACVQFKTSMDCKMKLVDQADSGYRVCDQQYFSIDSDGKITSSAMVDAERHLSFALDITAMDGRDGMLRHETHGTVDITVIDVNDHKPKFTNQSYIFKVPESITPNEPIGEVLATDDDRDAVHKKVLYQVQKDFQNIFEFKQSNKLYLKGAYRLDFENTKQFPKHQKRIYVIAKNEGTKKSTLYDKVSVTIDIQDVNEPPIEIPVKGEPAVLRLKEEGKPTTNPVKSKKIRAKDIDFLGNQTVTFGLLDPMGWFNLGGQRTISASQTNSEFKEYEVRVSLKPGVIVDRECSNCTRDGRYIFHVTATDDYPAVPATRAIPVTLQMDDINDNPPEFEDPSISICANNPSFEGPLTLVPGMEKVLIRDRDSSLNGAPFGVTYNQEISRGPLVDLANEFIDHTVSGEAQSYIKFSSKVAELPVGRSMLKFNLIDRYGLNSMRTLNVETCRCLDSGLCPRVGSAAIAPGDSDDGVLLWILAIVLGVILVLIVLAIFLIKRSRSPRKHPEYEADATYVADANPDREQLLQEHYQGQPKAQYPTSNKMVNRLARQNVEDYGRFLEGLKRELDEEVYMGATDELYAAPQEEGNGSMGELSSLCSSSGSDSVNYSPDRGWGPKFARLADICQGDEED